MEDSTGNDDYLNWKKKRKFLKKKAVKENKTKPWMNKAAQIDFLTSAYEDFDSSKAETYEDFPLSINTKDALKSCGFIKPTAIQKASILPALKGQDVLGAAKTGSGKTLAFIVPILECLNRHRWSSMDGPGALIISPTRELALQIFEVLCKVGCKHDFSAGLVIGGKNVKEEAERVCRTNIVVCTPGRLLQHLDSTSYFRLGNLKMLVLDEADRILDLGFSATINAILENLPSERQTLLFSATQTKSVKDLARLSLTNPAYISVHAESRYSTPSGLSQRYLICPLADKLNMLYSFVRDHVKSKTLVFVSSCKQVQYIYAAFCLLRPGVPIMHLHGHLNQIRRLAVYKEFCRKQFALLIATDIAARGLDFPAVDWVVQLDCPEDAETYIHRVGRTARFHGNGNALLLLLPSEKDGLLKQLMSKKIPIENSKVNTKKLMKIDRKLQSLCAQDQELKEKAKRCFVAYFKSIHLMKNKSIFKVKELSKDDYATSLGLAFPPRIRFLRKLEKQMSKRQPFEQPEQSEQLKASFSNKGLDDLTSGFDVSDDETALFKVKEDKVNLHEDVDEVLEPVEKGKGARNTKKRTRAKEARRLLKKGLKVNNKIIFDEEGEIEASWPPSYKETVAACSAENDKESDDPTGGLDITEAQRLMQVRDLEDRKDERKRIAKRHREARLKAKEERRQAQREKSGNYGDVELKSNFKDEGDRSDDASSSGTDHDEEALKPPSKRRKSISTKSKNKESAFVEQSNILIDDTPSMTIEEQEDIVLHLLNQ